MANKETYTTNPNIFFSVPFSTFFHNKVGWENTTYNMLVTIPTLEESLRRDFTEMDREEVSYVRDDMKNSLVSFHYVLDEFFITLVSGNLVAWTSLFAENIKKSYQFDQVRENAVELFGTAFLEKLLWYREHCYEDDDVTPLDCYINAVILEFMKEFNRTYQFNVEAFNNVNIWKAYQHHHLTSKALHSECKRLNDDIDAEFDLAKTNGLITGHDNDALNKYTHKIFCNANRIEL